MHRELFGGNSQLASVEINLARILTANERAEEAVPLAREAVAAMLPAVPLTQATGGTATVIGAGTIPVTNATAVHLRLVSVAPNPATQLLPGTTCAAGAELAPGGQCVLALGCAPALATPSLARPRAQGWGC